MSYRPTPSGTGVNKIVSGVEQTPASGLVDADVSASANIAQSKIANLSTDLAGKVSGSIAATQVAFGTGVNTVGGNAAFTYASNTLSVNPGGAFTNLSAAKIVLGESTPGTQTPTIQTSDGLSGTKPLDLVINELRIGGAAGSAGQVLTSQGAGLPPVWSAGGGTVTSVTASGPLSSSGGSTPDISLTGVVDVVNGGTGLATWGAAGRILVSQSATATSAVVVSGDGTMSSLGALTVSKVNGAAVPAAGALVNGNILQVNGASSLTYGPLNLAGGSGSITGVLPIANQSAPATADAFAYTSSAGSWNSTGIAGTDNLVGFNGTAPAAITVGSGLSLSGGTLTATGSGGTVTAVTASSPLASSGGTTPDISLSTSGVSADTYTNATVTVDVYGRVTAASSGAAPVTSVSTSSPVSGDGTVGSPVTIADAAIGSAKLASTGVSAGTYTNATVVVNAQGQLTSASSGTAPVTSVGASSPLASSGGATPTISLNTSGVVAATYSLATITVDSFGRVTSASDGSGVVTSVAASAPLASSGGATPTVSLNTSGVSAGAYSYANITVDTYGRVTSASSGVAPSTMTIGQIPTGLVDGSNVVYTTATNYQSNTTAVYLNGVRQLRGAGNDYIESAANQITFTVAPLTGYQIQMDYYPA